MLRGFLFILKNNIPKRKDEEDIYPKLRFGQISVCGWGILSPCQLSPAKMAISVATFSSPDASYSCIIYSECLFSCRSFCCPHAQLDCGCVSPGPCSSSLSETLTSWELLRRLAESCLTKPQGIVICRQWPSLYTRHIFDMLALTWML